jgi:hypothetical protein
MKTIRFLVTTISFGALSLGLGFAQPSGPAPQRPPSESRLDGKRSHQQQEESHASRMSNQNNGTKTTAKPHSGPKLPQPFQANGGHPWDKRANNAQTKGASAYAAGLHPPGLNKAAGSAKVVSMTMASQMENQHRLSLAGLSGTPAPHQVVHPLPLGPASLGGPTIWSARNTAAINGTGMKHRL